MIGLARSDAAANILARSGVEAHRGDLADTASLAAGARACDGVIHTAFIHDFGAYAAAAETDRRAVEALTGALEGSGKPFVLTSGTALLAPGRVGKETDAPAPGSAASLRAAAEATTLAAAGRGVRACVMRLPPSVHGAGDHGFVPALIDIARRTGVAAFIGDGANRWPTVHRLDAVRLYRLALEHATPGARLHAVAEEGVPLSAIAERRSARGSASQCAVSPKAKHPPTSTGWPRSSVSTIRLPAPLPARPWDGARKNPGCSRT